MKKVLAWLLVLALTAAISIGATLAYLTDTDEDVNVMTLGNVKIDQLEYERIDDETANENAEVQEFHDNKPLYPAVTENGFDYTPGNTVVDWEQIGKDGYTSEIWNPEKINNELDKMVFAKNKGTYDAYVRTIFAFEAGNYATLDQFKSMMHLNLNDTDWTWEWAEAPVTIGESTYFVAVATYNEILEPGAFTEISLSQVALDKTATNADVEAFGDTYQILVKTQAIQADGFATAADALNEGFGVIFTNAGTEDAPLLEVDPEDVPFNGDSAVAGSGLHNALRYLNADEVTDISTKVKSVTFGRNKDYADVVKGNNGILVDHEQDTNAYAYYIPNDTGYDIYILSDSTIYAPKDSGKLFNGFSALTAVNTDNLSFSRTTSLRTMFNGCAALTAIDVSGWDTSKVQDMTGIFNNCSALAKVEGTETWDLSSCTELYATFKGCAALKSVNTTGWDTSDVTNFQSMFGGCSALTQIIGIADWDLSAATNMTATFQNCSSMVQFEEDLANWDTGNVTTMAHAFSGCKKLKALNVANWDLSSMENMQQTFCYCHVVEELDVSNWDVSNISNFYGIFYQMYALKELDVSNWDTGSATNMGFLFAGCSGLKTLDLANWNTSNVTDMATMFSNDTALEYVDVSNWDTGKVTSTRIMFNYCTSLKELDVSNWDTGSLTTMEGMFNHCEKLEELDVSNWNTGKVTNMGTVFQQCWALKALDVSNWDTSSCTTMGWMFYGCNKVKVIDVSKWNVSKVTVMSHMFADCNSVSVLEVNNWDLSSLQSMDAIFNDCDSLITIEVGNWNTGTVREFSQIFDGCDNLQYIYGMENWDTTNGRNFDETFNRCYSLKELNLSGWDTRNYAPGYKNVNGDVSKGFSGTFDGPVSLTKLIIGENFSFNGNGTVKEANQAKLPAPAAKEGFVAKWRNVETGEIFAASEIPSAVAATYEAYYEPVTTN